MKFKNIYLNPEFIFYILILLLLSLVLLSHPFLRYPYDMYYHLITIWEKYDSKIVPENRQLWHYIWAKILLFAGVSKYKLFVIAKIIHIIQTYIAFFCIYFFAKVSIRNIFINVDITVLKYLALWSVLIWLTIFSTYSVNYHLIWNLWYSINYQITLPLFFYIVALTIIIILEEISWKKKLFYSFQILLISRFILQVHAMEFMYYLMYMSILICVLFDKLYLFIKNNFIITLLSFMIFIYFILNYNGEESRIINYIYNGQLHILYEQVLTNGKILIDGFNRAYYVINELMYIVLLLVILSVFLIIFLKIITKDENVNIRMLLFTVVTSSFILIPLNQLSSGLFSLITRIEVVHRIYYSSSLFVIIPIVAYLLFYYQKKYKILMINIFILLIVFFTYLYSKHSNNLNHNYYKNIQSAKNSFSNERFSFHLSEEQIHEINKHMEDLENKNKSNFQTYFFVRNDIAFVLKYLLGKENVFWIDHRYRDYKNAYDRYISNGINLQKEHYILFKTPDSFPEYIPYK